MRVEFIISVDEHVDWWEALYYVIPLCTRVYQWFYNEHWNRYLNVVAADVNQDDEMAEVVNFSWNCVTKLKLKKFVLLHVRHMYCIFTMCLYLRSHCYLLHVYDSRWSLIWFFCFKEKKEIILINIFIEGLALRVINLNLDV